MKKFPATGYEISKLANIPQSRTYDTLKNLENLNIVLSSNSKPITYTPIKPKELTKRYKRKFDSTINFLEKKLPDIKEEEYLIQIYRLGVLPTSYQIKYSDATKPTDPTNDNQARASGSAGECIHRTKLLENRENAYLLTQLLNTPNINSELRKKAEAKMTALLDQLI